MTDLRPFDWDEDRSATLGLLEAYMQFDAVCTLQEDIEAVYESHEAAQTLRDHAEALRARKWIIWAGEHSYGGAYNPLVSLNHLCTLAHNGLLEWRARRLHMMAERLSEPTDAE